MKTDQEMPSVQMMMAERIATATAPELGAYLQRHGERVNERQAAEISRAVSEFVSANLEAWSRADLAFDNVIGLCVAHGMGVIVRVLGLSLSPSPRVLN